MNEDEIKQIAALVIAELKEMNAVRSDPFADRILFRSSEMARRCGVSKQTWCKWVKAGMAPAAVMVGNARKWLERDIKEWEKDLKEQEINKVFETRW